VGTTTPVAAGQRITASVLNSLPVDLGALGTGSITNSVTETVIGTFSSAIPQNTAVAGSGYSFLISGTTDTTGTPTIQWRLYVGGIVAAQLIFDSGVQTTNGTATSKAYTVRAFLIVTGTGSSGTFESFGLVNSAHVSGGANYNSRTASTINTTVSNDVVLTAKWGTASSSNTARTLAGIAQPL
jgi:hypothetical protein